MIRTGLRKNVVGMSKSKSKSRFDEDLRFLRVCCLFLYTVSILLHVLWCLDNSDVLLSYSHIAQYVTIILIFTLL